MLPPLPKIRSERIETWVFTHSSLSDRRHDFQAPESDPNPDNEELGHIGDQVFSLAVTNLIQNLYPLLRVGPTSKVRDYVRRKTVLEELCVLYRLHERLKIPERQASLRSMQNVKVVVFKAYVGGVYRDQGFEVVSSWLSSLIRHHVERAYQTVRKEYLLPPTTTAASQPEEPITHYPLPSSPPLSGGARPDASICLVRSRGDPSRPVSQPEAIVSQRGSRKAGVDAGAPLDMADQPGRKRRRRRSKEDGSKVVAPTPQRAEDAQSQLRLSTGSDTTGSIRKRPRSGNAGAYGWTEGILSKGMRPSRKQDRGGRKSLVGAGAKPRLSDF